ncbi:SDR family NAD(P)-dependent oxidoreductase [Gracilibacillus salinarum]|uniref:SDR family oxidoreductase n=1 Tax=Gracilibacillus salinarum TaxID=2932255 RepID=A0ABY4GT03_9BACI|nr:SDR family oxidoreductase [Gracilibacillus salinarum]UOQ86362.1 SDR family oxidoreductase [Gracilibacillus salinarum]
MKQKRIIFITGATKGIGRNMAIYFAKRNYIVVGAGRDEQLLNEVRQQLLMYSEEHRMVAMDVTNLEEVHTTLSYVLDTFGKIDVWINNAGSFHAIGPTWEVNPNDFTQDMMTNVIGTYYCTSVITPVMIDQQAGKIVNLVGAGTFTDFPYGNGYSTSNTAIARFTENLAAELMDTNVEVYAFDPGLNDTDMTKHIRVSEEGKRYLSKVSGWFAEEKNVSCEAAPAWIERIVDGQVVAFQGRIISVYDEPEQLLETLKKNEAKYRLLR